MSESSARHAPSEVVDAYRQQGIPGTLLVDGTPTSRILIWPHHSTVSILVQADDGKPGPDLRERAHLEYELVEDAGTMWHRLNVVYDDNLTEVYSVLCSILDRVQLSGETFADAVDAVLAGLGDILAGRGGLSHEQQVGLFGELAVLLSLAADTTPREAITAWRGHQHEEHDFGLASSDVEVKTTTSEKRSHWISSLTQLLPTDGRELRLLSLQITAAGKGPGASLTTLVDAARALPGIPAAELERALVASGYFNRHADLYRSRWALRSIPTFHLVDEDFPALTPSRLADGVPNPERITDVRYRVDLQGLTPGNSLFPVVVTGVVEQ